MHFQIKSFKVVSKWFVNYEYDTFHGEILTQVDEIRSFFDIPLCFEKKTHVLEI